MKVCDLEKNKKKQSTFFIGIFNELRFNIL